MVSIDAMEVEPSLICTNFKRLQQVAKKMMALRFAFAEEYQSRTVGPQGALARLPG